ncbi:MAG: hypothetical protein QOK40_1737 [Miltoncostaeaceae bacterium]|nr:hypothetical protein [Miltoncostaeaceae bacterium]
MAAIAATGAAAVLAGLGGCDEGSARSGDASGTWRAPATIAVIPASRGVAVALDSRGGATALWATGARSTALEAAEAPPGGALSRPHLLWPSGPFPVSLTWLSVDRSDRALALWLVNDRNRTVLMSATRSAAGRWSAAVAVSRVVPRLSAVDVAVNRRGDAVAAWQAYDPAIRRAVVQAASRRGGGPFSDPVTVAHEGQFPYGELAVAIGEGGDAAVTWSVAGVGDYRPALVATHAPLGRWSSPVLLSRPSESTSHLRVAVDGRGGAMVAWMSEGKHRHTTGRPVVAASRTPAGRWTAPITVAGRVDAVDDPALAMSPGGDAVIAWNRVVGGNARLLAAARRAGAGWGAPVEIAAAPALNEPRPEFVPDIGPSTPFGGVRLTASPSGAVTAVWRRATAQPGRNPFTWGLESATWRDGRWEPPAPISGPTPAPPALEAIDVHPDGSATALLTRQAGSRTLIEESERR